MARLKARPGHPNPNWSAKPDGGPFSRDEDAQLIDMIICGLDSHFWQTAIPRRFGELLKRRCQLIDAGTVQLAREI